MVEAQPDVLAECLVLICRAHDRPHSAAALTAGLPLDQGVLTPSLVMRAAARAGLAGRALRRPIADLPSALLPAIVLTHDGAVVLTAHLDDGRMQVVDPLIGGGVLVLTAAELETRYAGTCIVLKPQFQPEARAGRAEAPGGHWFWGALRSLWPIYGEALAAGLLINVFALATPLFIMNVYDRVVPNQAIETLWVLAIGVGIVYAFDVLMRTLRGYFLDLAGKKFDVVQSTRLFERVMGIRMASRPGSVGVFAARLQEFDSFREFFTSAVLTTIVDLPFVFLFLGLIFWLGGPLVIPPLVALPVVIGYGYLAHRRLRAITRESYLYTAQKQGTLVEALTGLETLKATGATGAMQRRWEAAVGRVARLGMSARVLAGSVGTVASFSAQLSTVAIVLLGAYRLGDGNLSLGGLIACVLLSGRALAPMGQLAAILGRYDQSLEALKGLDSIMQLPVERPADRHFLHRPVLAGGIEFARATFRYPEAEVTALDAVSLRIAPGERVGVIGRIGSGKSTLARLILGFYDPQEGAVLLDGTDARQIDPADIRRNMGYVPQDVMLFYGTLRQNITLAAPHVEDSAVERAARIAGVTSFVARHPKGFDLQVGERGEGLSGGQRQAVAVARALLLDPPILLMDEPTNAMDNSSESHFKTELEAILPGKTLVLVTHRASLLSLVERLIVMDGGRVVADGPREQVLEALRKGRLRGSVT